MDARSFLQVGACLRQMFTVVEVADYFVGPTGGWQWRMHSQPLNSGSLRQSRGDSSLSGSESPRFRHGRYTNIAIAERREIAALVRGVSCCRFQGHHI